MAGVIGPNDWIKYDEVTTDVDMAEAEKRLLTVVANSYWRSKLSC
jgi:hypothetical protein